MPVLTENEILAKELGFDDPSDDTDGMLKGARQGARFDLPNGAVRRPGLDLNDHFVSSNVQPWPHSDIYTSDMMAIDKEGMDDEQLEKYEDQYGSTANAYLRGEAAPKRITGIFQKYGDATKIIKQSISSNHPVYLRNMCRIVAIYMDDGGGENEFGANHTGKITDAQKKRGMAYGVYALTTKLGGESVMNEVCYGWKNTPKFMPDPSPGDWRELWPPVFGKKKKGKTWVPNTPDFKNLKISSLNLKAGVDADAVCGQRAFQDWWKSVESTMTVQQWVTTPWHYHTLPYRQKRILFEDGETYSEGCKRCSRPFFEYEHMYSWFLRGPEGTAHFPNSYWCTSEDGKKTCNKALAPKPFHHPAFWELPTGRAVTKKGEDTVLPQGAEDTNGWHGWPLWAFKFGRIPKTQKEYELLAGEYNTRKNKKDGSGKVMLPAAVSNLPSSGANLLYKRYTNHAWRDRLDFWDGEYPMCVQSRFTSKRAKLQMGMRDYCLQRASKYGNICHDCATVLELAPGLLIRNYRKKTFQANDFHAKMKLGDEAKGRDGNTYWTKLLSRYDDQQKARGALATDDLRVDEMVNFDLEGWHAQKVRLNTYVPEKHGPHRRWKRRFNSVEANDKSMQAYADMIASHHEMALGVDNDGQPLTKYNSPPEIYIQKELELKSGVFGAVDHEQIKHAVAALVKMRPLTEEVMVNGRVTDVKVTMPDFWTNATPQGVKERERVFAMPALQHMIFELERKYMHTSQFTRDKQTKVFDSDMTRLECRDVTKSLGGVEYANCLVVKQYVPPKMSKGKAVQQNHSETVYYYDHKNGRTPTIGTEEETMWRGDQYATTVGQGGNRQKTQYRKMRQSRLFITYSLHRATTSENEARFLMMRMADAAHELFGNDQNLAELLVFGYKIAAGGKGKQDSISQGGFELIEKPNKKDQEANFYGGGIGGSSYIYDTYQTHVDKVDLDGGIEIGPQRHHPHFHMLLTINHWSYIQIDYFKMNAYLEMMFKGIDPLLKGWDDRFQLLDSSGNLFYTDNENPYVDIKLYPQDNWNDIISAYVRKNAVPGPIEAQRVARDAI